MERKEFVEYIIFIFILFAMGIAGIVAGIHHTKVISEGLETFTPTKGVRINYEIGTPVTRGKLRPNCQYVVDGENVTAIHYYSIPRYAAPRIGETVNIKYDPQNPEFYLITDCIDKNDYYDMFFFGVVLWMAGVLATVRLMAICREMYRLQEITGGLALLFGSIFFIVYAWVHYYGSSEETFSLAKVLANSGWLGVIFPIFATISGTIGCYLSIGWLKR